MTTRRLRPRRQPPYRHSTLPLAICVDGRVVLARQAFISIDDWACRYGWGVFETIRVQKGCPLFLQRHLDRFSRAARVLQLADGRTFERSQWHDDIGSTLRRAGATEAVVNLYWTRGQAPDFAGRKIVCARAFPDYPRRPLRLWPAPWRIDPTCPGIGAKTMAYFPYAFASMCARQNGCDEAILLNSQNRLADGAYSSVFLIEQDHVLTPSLPEGALAGVTRSVILEAAAELGIPARQCRISWKRLLSADSLFVTSVLRGVAPVIEIRRQRRFTAAGHPVFSRLKAAYRKKVVEEIAAAS